ncbi:hypothetical protein GJAV_G00227410 [Gymnothorax javanicus]|nr:hypothetical protein GJAV_G00227410 [Gymnothorax javanicus]
MTTGSPGLCRGGLSLLWRAQESKETVSLQCVGVPTAAAIQAFLEIVSLLSDQRGSTGEQNVRLICVGFPGKSWPAPLAYTPCCQEMRDGDAYSAWVEVRIRLAHRCL